MTQLPAIVQEGRERDRGSEVTSGAHLSRAVREQTKCAQISGSVSCRFCLTNLINSPLLEMPRRR